jgi:hypothetical protein
MDRVNNGQANSGIGQPVTQDISGPSADIGDESFLGITECFDSEDWANENVCFDEFISDFAGDQSIGEILAALERSRSLDPDIESTCHPITHAVGRYSLQKHGNVGDAFEACDYTCHSGCYHGVMERLFYSEEELAAGVQHLSLEDLQERIPGICDADNFNDPSRPVIFQCLHGVGHAILYTLDYNLEESLEACDYFATTYERTSCYGGVFMENVTAFETDKRDYDYSDAQYPCNKVGDSYKRQCYLMQTSVMADIGLTQQEIVDACYDAGDYRTECFKSVGRDLSNNVRTGNPQYVADTCQTGYTRYTEECIRGSIYALIDNSWDGKYAYQLCNLLNDEQKGSCYENASFYLKATKEYDTRDIEEGCEKFAGDNVDTCKEKS